MPRAIAIFSIFSNGQLGYQKACVKLNYKKKYYYIDIDYFSNTLWQNLDQPKLFINLLRFDRKYLNKNF